MTADGFRSPRPWHQAQPWGLSLREAVGRATGVMVRLAAAEVGLPEDDGALALLEVKTAERLSECFESRGLAGLEAYRPKAVTLLQRAFRSYVRERGGKDVPSVWGYR